MIGNTDYPGYNVNQRSLLVNGRTQMNGNLTINGNISVNSTNIALGFKAGNIVNGDQVGLPNGLNSTAVGSYSGMNHTGTNNTFIGSIAGQASTSTYFSRTGNNNTYVGYAAQADNSAWANSTAIGTGAVITASNQIVLGTTTEQVVIKGNLYSKATATNQSIATFEGPGGGGSTVNLDLCSYLNSSRIPTNRITCIDDGAYSGHYVFYSKTPGADLNTLTERMRIASDGTVSIPGKITYNTSPAILRNANSTQNIPSSSDTIVLFQTNSSRSGTLTGLTYSNGYFTNSNSYMITVTVNTTICFTNNTTGFRVVFLYHSAIGRLSLTSVTANNGDITMIGTGCTFTMNSGEYFVVNAYQNSGTGLTIVNSVYNMSLCSVLVM